MSARLARTAAIALASLSALALSACGGSEKKSATTTTTTTPKSDLVATKDESGRTLSMKVGQTLDVELPVASGTNYAWKPGTGNKAFSPTVLSQEGAPKEVSSNPGIPGASTVTIFRYKAIGAGKTDLWLILTNNSTGASGESVHYIVTVA